MLIGIHEQAQDIYVETDFTRRGYVVVFQVTSASLRSFTLMWPRNERENLNGHSVDSLVRSRASK